MSTEVHDWRFVELDLSVWCDTCNLPSHKCTARDATRIAGGAR